MSYKEVRGNIFNSKAMAVVNTVNCVGAMGKGIALDFKLRFPKMFKEYQKICFSKKLYPGQILPYHDNHFLILNFAIKDDWKDPSKVEWVEETLKKFRDNYKRLGVTSIAFPWMGAMNGGIPIETIKALTRKYLSDLEDVDIEVYDFDPQTPCYLYEALRNIIDKKIFQIEELTEISKIQQRYWVKIIDAMNDPQTTSLNLLCLYVVNDKRIIGKTNIERLFVFLSDYVDGKYTTQKHLF
jgi:O-acetyl-ADP-ribose deacetylase (regulator of RNase III)